MAGRTSLSWVFRECSVAMKRPGRTQSDGRSSPLVGLQRAAKDRQLCSCVLRPWPHTTWWALHLGLVMRKGKEYISPHTHPTTCHAGLTLVSTLQAMGQEHLTAKTKRCTADGLPRALCCAKCIVIINYDCASDAAPFQHCPYSFCTLPLLVASATLPTSPLWLCCGSSLPVLILYPPFSSESCNFFHTSAVASAAGLPPPSPALEPW